VSYGAFPVTQRYDEAERRWKVQGSPGLCWRAWDEEHVVFHPASGDTHLLNAFTAEVLHAIEECPASGEELTQLFSPACDTEDESALRQQISNVLARFHELGLIEPAHE
jgi:PqqD family protein of HPr-rel-A system